MIPKIFHYIWFGPYTDSQTCYQHWTDECKDFKTHCWTNDNIKKFVDEAVYLFKDTKNKPVTYVSDLVRLLILYEHGGIYVDHDIMLLKNISELLMNHDMILTFQYRIENKKYEDAYGRGMKLKDIVNDNYGISLYHSDNVNNCLIGVTKNNKHIKRAIEITLENHFAQESEQFPMSDWGAGPSVFTQLAKEIGIDTHNPITQCVNNVVIYESSFLHPVHGVEKIILGREKYNQIIENIKEQKNSYAVHLHEHFGAGKFLKDELILFDEWYRSIS